MVDELVGCRRLIAALILRAVRDAFAGDIEAWRWLESPQAERYGGWCDCSAEELVRHMERMSCQERMTWCLMQMRETL